MKTTRSNWWTAFKSGISIPGYHYYKPPDVLKYRYPAPGSEPLDERSHGHLFKNDYKQPYRESPYYVQKTIRTNLVYNRPDNIVFQDPIPLDENNPSDRELLKEKNIGPDPDVKVIKFDDMTKEEFKEVMWKSFEEASKNEDYNYEDDYNP